MNELTWFSSQVLPSQHARWPTCSATATWLRFSAPAGTRNRFFSVTKLRPCCRLSFFLTCTTTTSTWWLGSSCQDDRQLPKELVSFVTFNSERFLTPSLCRGLPVHLPRATCLRQRINLVRFEGPLPIRIRWIVHSLLKNFTTSCRSPRCALRNHNFYNLRCCVLHSKVCVMNFLCFHSMICWTFRLTFPGKFAITANEARSSRRGWSQWAQLTQTLTRQSSTRRTSSADITTPCGM